MVEEIRLGSILVWPRSGKLAGVLAPAIRFLDPDPWIRKNWRFWYGDSSARDPVKKKGAWHLNFISGQTVDGRWMVRNVGDDGAKPVLLDDLGKDYTVINWIQKTVTIERIATFEHFHECVCYDKAGYLAAAANRKSERIKWLQNTFFPKVTNDDLYCWEDVSDFCDWCDEPFMEQNKMAWMPELIKKYTLRQQKAVADARR